MAELLIKSEPLYVQLKKKLIDFIWETHSSMLPDERTIAVSYNVSRITVRKALSELESDGFVERVQGRGTMVLKGNKTASTDLVVLSGMVDEYIRGIFATAVDEASKTGFNLNTLIADIDDADIAMPASNSVLSCLAEGRKIAALILLSRISEKSVSHLLSRKIPLLTCMFKYKNFDIPAVLHDFEKMMADMISTLLPSGINRIAVAVSHTLTEAEDPATGAFNNVRNSYFSAVKKFGIHKYSFPLQGTASIDQVMENFYAMPPEKRPQVVISPFIKDEILTSKFLKEHPDWKVLHIRYDDSKNSRLPRVYVDSHEVIRSSIKLAVKRVEHPEERFDDIKVPAGFNIPPEAIKKYLLKIRRK